MSRTKGGVKSRRTHKKWMKLSKGFCGRRSKIFKMAKLAVIHSLQYAYIGRKNKKRSFRSLWLSRISAAVKEHNFSYSKFIHGLKKSNVELDRKILASIACEDSKTFSSLVETSKAALR